MSKPIVWTMTGNDPTGFTDNSVAWETFKHLNVEPYSILSTEQIATACQQTPPHPDKPRAIKIGTLENYSEYEKIACFLNTYATHVVFDPVLTSSNTKLQLANLQTLLPCVDIMTLNSMEAENILNRSLRSYAAIEEGAHALLDFNVKSILITGGHLRDKRFSQDYWTNGQESFWIATLRSPEKNYYGAGCALSAAITACLALGYDLKDALVIAKMYVNRGIRQALHTDNNTTKLFHQGWPEDQTDLPYLSSTPLLQQPKPFKPCHLGFYPIVNNSRWLEKLLPQGVKCIQLRTKNTPQSSLTEEIQRSVAIANQFSATLFINDYWELAIRYGAPGIHLGQEDLVTADLETIHRSGLCLGVSTHCYHEVARAHAINPSYIACGPIYTTTSKVMSFQPQGITQLIRWRRTLDYPLVAIGGINLERLPDILQSGVDGVALISAITEAHDPLEATQKFLTTISEHALRK